MTATDGPVRRDTGLRPGVVPAIAALVCTLVPVLVLTLVPLGTSQSGYTTSDGTTVVHTERFTLLENEGAGVILVLVVPSAIALTGLAGAAFGVRTMSVGAAVVAFTVCFLAMLSVGVFYLPAAILLVVAAARSASK